MADSTFLKAGSTVDLSVEIEFSDSILKKILRLKKLRGCSIFEGSQAGALQTLNAIVSQTIPSLTNKASLCEAVKYPHVNFI